MSHALALSSPSRTQHTLAAAPTSAVARADAVALAAAAAAVAPQQVVEHHEYGTVSYSAIAPPLDYSFQEIKSLAELSEHEPSSGKKRSAEEQNTAASRHDAVEDKFNRHPTAVTCGIRLSYNELTTLSGLLPALEQVMDNPIQNLTWIDLSHNKLTAVDSDLLQFPNLAVIYLHGNQIRNLSEVKKLAKFRHLVKLTMHGNPLYEAKQAKGTKGKVRSSVLQAVGLHLKSLDFVPVTPREQEDTFVWATVHNKSKKKKKQSSEEDKDRRDM